MSERKERERMKVASDALYAGPAGSGTIMQTIYEHGGSRIWMEYEDGSRDLLADTYDGEELAKKVRAAIEAHFFPNIPAETRASRSLQPMVGQGGSNAD